MLIDLVMLTTEDKVQLPAGYFPPSRAPFGPVDAVVLNPGTSSAFHFPSLTAIAADLAANGYAALTMSSRGHDLVFRDQANGRYLGAAYEKITDCTYDLNAGINELVKRGHKRVAVLGHSLGGAKALWYSAHTPHPNQAGVIGCSAPRWSAKRYRESERSADYIRNYDEAKAMADTGRGQDLFTCTYPLGPMWYQADAWLEKYEGERYNMAEYAAKIEVPLLYVIGEPEIDAPGFRDVKEDLMSLATKSRGRSTATIPDADHFYSKGKTKDVAEAIVNWLDGLQG